MHHFLLKIDYGKGLEAAFVSLFNIFPILVIILAQLSLIP